MQHILDSLLRFRPSRVALEELSDEEVKVVRRLPFGLWDLTENDEKVRLDASTRSIYQSHPSVFTVTAAIALCILLANPELR